MDSIYLKTLRNDFKPLGKFFSFIRLYGVVLEEEGGCVQDRGGESSTKFESLNQLDERGWPPLPIVSLMKEYTAIMDLLN